MRRALALLDTNVLIHLLRRDRTGQKIEAEHSFTTRSERPILSSVVEVELLAFARYNGWGSQKLGQLRSLLTALVRVDAGLPEIVEAYAELHAEATKTGQPKGENDLWIAATAKAVGAELYTCNGGHFAWMHPAHLTVHVIKQSR